MNNRRTDKTRREPEEPVRDESVLDEAKKGSDATGKEAREGAKRSAWSLSKLKRRRKGSQESQQRC